MCPGVKACAVETMLVVKRERRSARERGRRFIRGDLSKGCTAKLEVTWRTAVARILWHGDARFNAAGERSKRSQQGDPNARQSHYNVTPQKLARATDTSFDPATFPLTFSAHRRSLSPRIHSYSAVRI